MRFTDGKEKLEIEIHEGQHSWDTTVGFFAAVRGWCC